MWWSPQSHPGQIERDCIRYGGRWKKAGGEEAGEGLYYHYRKFHEILWPDKKWHKWNELQLECFVKYTYIGEMGCAAAGKSDTAASNFLADWYAFPECTTTLVSSTTLESLDLRVWGMIKAYHRRAKALHYWVPGHLIEGRRVIIYDEQQNFSEGRDFKNGLIAVPCKKGASFVGLGSYIGIHNKRVRLVGDELQLMPRAFMDSISNLSKCEDFKLAGMGNPNETTNAHGFLCEPATHLGGWEGGIDQSPKTKTWQTNWPNGICIQLPGGDSPNFDNPEDEPPKFPFLMTRKQMQDDAKIWGEEDWHFSMMNNARMPRGQGSRRILTKQICEKFGALNEPNWRDTRITKIAFLDAAYRGVGGDRCVFGELQFGEEAVTNEKDPDNGGLISQVLGTSKGKSILSLVDLAIIPIDASTGAESPEDQIVSYVKNQCENRGINPDHFYFDSGMRTTLVTAFARGWSAMVNSVDCGGAPTEELVSADIKVPCREYYKKFVTELWFSVRMTVECGQFRGMTKEAMWEFCAREWKHSEGSNRIEVETKEEMKKKTGRSPDLADAVAIGVYGARRRGFVISKSTLTGSESKGPDWRDDVRRKASQIWRAKELNHRA